MLEIFSQVITSEICDFKSNIIIQFEITCQNVEVTLIYTKKSWKTREFSSKFSNI